MLGPKSRDARRRWAAFSAASISPFGSTFLSVSLRRFETDSLSMRVSPAAASWPTTVSTLWLTNAMASGSSAGAVRMLTGSVGSGLPSFLYRRRFLKCP